MRDLIFLWFIPWLFIKISPDCCPSKRVLTAGFVLNQLAQCELLSKFEPPGVLNFNIERFAVGLLGFSTPPGPLLRLVPFILLTTAGLFSDLQNARRLAYTSKGTDYHTKSPR
jgi:hypothetical protein